LAVWTISFPYLPQTLAFLASSLPARVKALPQGLVEPSGGHIL